MKISRRAIYIIAAAVMAVFLFGNEGGRRMIRRYWELHKLRFTLEQSKRENELLKKEIYLLEHDQDYVEHIARRELGLLAPGEVEYRFKK